MPQSAILAILEETTKTPASQQSSGSHRMIQIPGCVIHWLCSASIETLEIFAFIMQRNLFKSAADANSAI